MTADLEFSDKTRMRMSCHQAMMRMVEMEHSSSVTKQDQSQKRISGGTSILSIHAGIDSAKIVKDVETDTWEVFYAWLSALSPVLTVSIEILKAAAFRLSALTPLPMWQAWTGDRNVWKAFDEWFMTSEIIETSSVILKTGGFKVLLSTVKSALMIHMIAAEMSDHHQL